MFEAINFHMSELFTNDEKVNYRQVFLNKYNSKLFFCITLYFLKEEEIICTLCQLTLDGKSEDNEEVARLYLKKKLKRRKEIKFYHFSKYTKRNNQCASINEVFHRIT